MRVKCLLLMMLLAFGTPRAESPMYTVGAGLGVGFGGFLGVGAEAEWRRASLLLGAGTWSGGDVIWEMGVRYYFRDLGQRLRPHLSATYGTAIEYGYVFADGPYAGSYTMLIRSFNLLAGVDHDIGRVGGFMMSYGLGWALPGKIPTEDKERFEAAGATQPQIESYPTMGIGIKYRI